jgi:dihydrofolate reductase
MGRIVVSQNVTVDGVVQDPNGDEGFAYGGWFTAMSPQTRAEWAEVELQEALDGAAWLVGRGTWTWFADRWADRPGEWADRLRSLPKHVVTSTPLETTRWANSSVLDGDLLDEVTKLRANVNGDILVYGSAPLVHTLMEHNLVDELRLMTHPFVLGSGDRMFRPTTDRKPMRLVGNRTIGSLALLTYQPA